MNKFEKTYGFLFKSMVVAVNPIKSAITQPECIIHRFINYRAIHILNNDGYRDAYEFFSDYLKDIDEGVVWADQDMKSSGHFYHPEKERGLYGNKDALSLSVEYYDEAMRMWKQDSIEKSMFFLGACAHLLQDMTVPQHANNRLLDDHRKYEMFVRGIFEDTKEFWVHKGAEHFNSIEEAIRDNARIAMKVYWKLIKIGDESHRFYTMTKFLLPLAQRYTAGLFLKFYKDIGKNSREISKSKPINFPR